MNSLLIDAYDLHVHSGPDVLPRKFDDIDMGERIIASGMKGYALKSHYFCTSERASLIRKLHPCCQAIGTITLNSSVGGINPAAVEMAGRSGAKIVWFPTVDSENEMAHLAHSPAAKQPYWAMIKHQMAAEGIHAPTINIMEKGKLKDEVLSVLEIMARFDMILATSHVSKAEAFALVKAARERKIERIIITHATYPSTFYSIEEQREFLKYGAVIEHCYTTISTGKVAWEVVIEQIRAIGSGHVILGTDLGGKTTDLFPDEGLALFGQKLIENGFTEEDVRNMIVRNPAALVG